MPPLVLTEQSYCGECGLTFQAALFSPPERRALRRADLEQGQAQCARHARNAAVGTCERCGAFMCALCRVDADGKSFCASCFERLRREGGLESARTTFRSWRTLGFHLAVAGFPLMAFGVLIGPLSIVASLRGLAQDRKEGTEGGWWGAAGSMLLALLVTLGGALFAFGSFLALTRRP